MGANAPPGHALQAAAREMNEKLPAAHKVHGIWPLAEYEPGRQSLMPEHTVVPVTMDWLHSAQKAAPLFGWYVPKPQLVHCAAPAAE